MKAINKKGRTEMKKKRNHLAWKYKELVKKLKGRNPAWKE